MDRAREGDLDESSRRRLTMVLRSHRDAALELAWMSLFDDVREPRVDCEAVITRVVRQVPTAMAPPEVTRRVCAIEVDEDARTRRLPALDLASLAPSFELDLEELLEVDEPTRPRAQPPERAVASEHGPLRRRKTEQTAPWAAVPARRDPTPQGTRIESRGRSGRTWMALALTAAMSIAVGWLAHAWWDALVTPAPAPVASPPTRLESDEVGSTETSTPGCVVMPDVRDRGSSASGSGPRRRRDA
ncbi:MAG: hypothetical protein H6723_18580 [Sandaracinus sp.]|nr:hypothetical protein [Sandaracinus sp.]